MATELPTVAEVKAYRVGERVFADRAEAETCAVTEYLAKVLRPGLMAKLDDNVQDPVDQVLPVVLDNVVLSLLGSAPEVANALRRYAEAVPRGHAVEEDEG